MPPRRSQVRLETKALVVGYAMSRLDRHYLDEFKVSSWTKAFSTAGAALGVTPASLKHLRDEFDPFHDNGRRGWHGRALRPNRQRVLGELCAVSDEALLELVRRLIDGEPAATDDAIDALTVRKPEISNVAERLLTGRLAEEYFLKNSRAILGIDPADIVDCRQSALGFDFGVTGTPDRAIEIKGMKGRSGQILFTDREWSEAGRRKGDYWLVVVGSLARRPVARAWKDPRAVLTATCRYQQAIQISWTSTVTVEN